MELIGNDDFDGGHATWWVSKPDSLGSRIVELVEVLEPLRDGVLEAREVAEPFEIDFADGAVALLGDDDLGLAGVLSSRSSPRW